MTQPLVHHSCAVAAPFWSLNLYNFNGSPELAQVLFDMNSARDFLFGGAALTKLPNLQLPSSVYQPFTCFSSYHCNIVLPLSPASPLLPFFQHLSELSVPCQLWPTHTFQMIQRKDEVEQNDNTSGRMRRGTATIHSPKALEYEFYARLEFEVGSFKLKTTVLE